MAQDADMPTAVGDVGSEGQPVASRRPANGMRRLYNWVLGWADTPYGTPALVVISFAESSFFPIPPDVLQIALSFAKPRRAFLYAFASAVASVLGGIAGWAIGYWAWISVGEVFFQYVPGVTPENVNRVGELYRENAFLAIFTAAFTPIPFKVFTIAAGVFHDYVSLATLVAASSVGRTARFMLVAASIYFFGPRIRVWLEKYFELASLLLGLLAVLGFVALKYLH